jgi:hypothetical protein
MTPNVVRAWELLSLDTHSADIPAASRSEKDMHDWFHCWYRGEEIRKDPRGIFGTFYRRPGHKFPDWHYIFATENDAAQEIDSRVYPHLHWRVIMD